MEPTHDLNPKSHAYSHTSAKRTTRSGEGDLADPVLVDDVDDDDEAAVVLAVVHQGHPPDLDKPLERLHKHDNTKARIVIS